MALDQTSKCSSFFKEQKIKIFFTQTDFSKDEEGSSPLFPQSGSSIRLQVLLAENTHPSLLETYHYADHTVKKSKKSKTTPVGD